MPVSSTMSAALKTADFEGTISYRTISNPGDVQQKLDYALLHMFNHQTHHRGQVHCLLTRITGKAPSFDLIVYQREVGVGLVAGAPPAASGPQRRVARPLKPANP